MAALDDEINAGTVFGGTWRHPHGGTYTARDAATGTAIGTVGLADADDVATAGLAARSAQPAWAELGFRERAAVMHRAAEFLEELPREDRLLLQREEGAIAAKVNGEIHKSAEELRAAASLLEQPYGDLLPNEDPTILSMARRVPAGVIGVIAPWNAPMLLAMRSVAPALALGNAVILKPDVKTAISGGIVIAKAFEAAGLPAGVLHVLPGGPETGEAVVASPHTDVISFTGSTAAGRRVGEVAGRLLKKVVLELGGNNALIVLDDADLDEAVSAALSGSLLHNGQICMATGRHLVHDSIADEYTRRLCEAVAAMKVGDPTDPATRVGPLISEKQAERVASIVGQAVADGARVLVGGERSGPFYTPTVLGDVDPGNAAFENEIFGPVLPVTSFSDDDEAVRWTNASEYGLSAAVHTGDLTRGLALAARVRTGMVHINGMTINDAPHVPMGGVGQSGNGGRYGGHWNLDEFTSWQWVTARGPRRD
ncbi:aldehyde dehydrogenase family protein [Agromyces archimandritae]|uniref:Aldehyde dehydrogenase family protein n=1 Tax=Agromyces archimandritae TaxID=2781962 RepID=A0A975FME0_9MICO|nr:aldehyde dehydrogenase family protein [Agromyces archimandritae]QTX04382.1 aldehyde dehydrogenase family protein [Agromyces archimandritae]